MCFGLVVAIPEDGVVALSPPDGSELSVWPISNPWGEGALDNLPQAFVIGDYGHCSCARVPRVPSGLMLDSEAARLIADAAEAAGRAAFLVHWFSGQFDAEEFLAESGGGVSTHRLRSGYVVPGEDQVVWVG